MKRTEDLLSLAVQNTTVKNMLDVVQNRDVDMVNGVRGPSSLFTTTLAKGAVKTDIRSYAPQNVAWNISSGYIMHEVMLFAARAANVFQQTPGLEVCSSRQWLRGGWQRGANSRSAS
jgi:hypothetical protein